MVDCRSNQGLIFCFWYHVTQKNASHVTWKGDRYHLLIHKDLRVVIRVKYLAEDSDDQTSYGILLNLNNYPLCDNKKS